MKSCAICQPNYLPWLGYFEMIDRVDVYVFLDDVQYVKREWMNRNQIRKTPYSEEKKWISVPIVGEDQRNDINKARISDAKNWIQKHNNQLESVYNNAPFYEKHIEGIMEHLKTFNRDTLADLNIPLVKYFCDLLGIEGEFVRSSRMDAEGEREEKLRNICVELDADFYLANDATGEYVGEEYFQERSVEFETQRYKHPEYKQYYNGKELPFVSHLSIVDLLFNVDENPLEIIQRGRPSDSALVE